MGAQLLKAKAVPRPWGRRHLPNGFTAFETDEPIGEIWHCPIGGERSPLLVKHLFTAERLSIQVHPDDQAARRNGFPRGKSEAWLVLEAEADACIALGLVRRTSAEKLRAAAASGEIEQLVDWHPARSGDFFYSPAGTIHAIGPGLSLIEIQQNVDVTYRLYDYGRPRELHLDQALAVAVRQRWQPGPALQVHESGRTILCSGGEFVVEAWQVDRPTVIAGGGEGTLVIHKAGAASLDGAPLGIGSVWTIDGSATIEPAGRVELIVAYAGEAVMDRLRQET